jgi:hypothetical protein
MKNINQNPNSKKSKYNFKILIMNNLFIFNYLKNVKCCLILYFFLSTSFGTTAQNLVVTLIDNTTQSFPITTIESLKFISGNMILKQNDGITITWTTSSINNYSFGTLSTQDYLIIETSELQIYPNPSNGLVNLRFNSNINLNIQIDIIDINGKIVSSIYNGNHDGEKTYQWTNNVNQGIYFCRLITDHKIISKPIIIK